MAITKENEMTMVYECPECGWVNRHTVGHLAYCPLFEDKVLEQVGEHEGTPVYIVKESI